MTREKARQAWNTGWPPTNVAATRAAWISSGGPLAELAVGGKRRLERLERLAHGPVAERVEVPPLSKPGRACYNWQVGADAASEVE